MPLQDARGVTLHLRTELRFSEWWQNKVGSADFHGGLNKKTRSEYMF